MYKIAYYTDHNGKQPVKKYLEELKKQDTKESRSRLKSIAHHLAILELMGTRAKKEQVKHLRGDIWELRPQQDRILFIGWHEGHFVLLHHYTKKTDKIPDREFETAKRRYKALQEGVATYEA